jgi:hypothetical protein|tara:strand:+ start:1855 stop:2466 length:612 start_codon:yes stop_codon:yes gene_type:complete
VTKRIPIHQRNYITEAFDEGDGRMRVSGRLVDNKPQGLCLDDGTDLVIHDMGIDLLIDPPSFTIVDVENHMSTRPYAQCEQILDSYKALIGLSVTRGYGNRVKKLFGGPNGCSHMGALLLAMGPVAIQASWSLVNLHESLESRLNKVDNDHDRERRLQLNMNTCHVWKEEGQHIQLIKLGKRAPLPDWESERLMELGVEVPKL